jgi:phage shock protein C
MHARPEIREEIMAMGDRKLRRSRNRVIAGVCGGLAEWLGWPANRVRVAYVVISILSAAFPGMLTYLILWFLMPGPEGTVSPTT